MEPLDRSRGFWVAASIAGGLAVTRVVAAGHEMGIDSFRYLDAADAIAGDGSLSEQRYPPGFPTMIAAVDLLGLPVWTTTTLAGVALVTLIWCSAIRLGGPVAGVAAGAFCIGSDLVAESGVLLMSDTPAAALLMAGLLACLHGRWTLAGGLVACSAWVRLPHVLFMAASSRLRMAVACVAGLAPLAVFNLMVFGSLGTYRSDQASWQLTYLWDGVYVDNAATPWGNHEFYLSVLGGRWGLLIPLLPIAAGIEVWRRWHERPTRFAVGIIALNLAVYLFYFYQSARFVLPTAAVIVVYAAAWVGRMFNVLTRGKPEHAADISEPQLGDTRGSRPGSGRDRQR